MTETSQGEPQEPTQSLFDQLPNGGKLGILNEMINDRNSVLMGTDLGSEERIRIGGEVWQLTVRREAQFMVQLGVEESAAEQLAGRILGEGLHITNYMLPQDARIGEMDLRWGGELPEEELEQKARDYVPDDEEFDDDDENLEGKL